VKRSRALVLHTLPFRAILLTGLVYVVTDKNSLIIQVTYSNLHVPKLKSEWNMSTSATSKIFTGTTTNDFTQTTCYNSSPPCLPHHRLRLNKNMDSHWVWRNTCAIVYTHTHTHKLIQDVMAPNDIIIIFTKTSKTDFNNNCRVWPNETEPELCCNSNGMYEWKCETFSSSSNNQDVVGLPPYPLLTSLPAF